MSHAARVAFAMFCAAMFVAFAPGGVAPAMRAVAAAAVARADDPELVRLAERAKAAFAARMEPPPIELTVADIWVRDSTAVVRDLVRESYDAAVDALLAEARAPERAPRVKAALRELVDTRYAAAAEAIFTEILERKAAEGGKARREAAAAARHSVALVELPAALAPLIKLPSEAVPFAPLGEKAAPAYARAAELDPDDPWTWIVLAELANSADAFNGAIQNAGSAAEATHDTRAMIVALHVFGVAQAGAGGHAQQAARAYTGALSLADAWTKEEPASPEAQRYLALGLNRAGDALMDQKRYDQAAAAYQKALAIRAQLAEADPDEAQRQVDLVASHMNLFALGDVRQDRAEAKAHWDEAARIYDTLVARDPLRASYSALQSGAVAVVLVTAGGLTLLIGLIALARYRQVIRRYMRLAGTSATTVAEAAVRPGTAAPGRGVPLAAIDAGGPSRRSSFRSQAIAGGKRAAQRAALVYAIAGLAFAIVAAIVWLRNAGIEITWPRLTGVVLAWAWPVVFALALLWGPDRRRLALLVAGYFAVLLAFCARIAFSETPPLELWGVTIPPFFQPLYFVASHAAPSLFLLLFLNRQVRAIGPVVIVLMIIVAIGTEAAMVAASTYVGLKLMSSLPASAAFFFLPVRLLGMLLFLPLGWLTIVGLRRGYDRKRFSEQSLVHDSLWLFQTLLLCQHAVLNTGLTGWLAVGVFAVYRLITWIGLRPLAAAAASRRPARLLLLRTFGFRKRSERFFDLLGARWRYAGPIQLIAAPDLAGRSIDPDEFLDFLSGRLRHRFILEPKDLARRITEMDNHPDPDGRYRVNEFFCGNDAWRPTVKRLMAESDMVAMDLRGFSPAKEGCRFELQALIDSVGVARVVLLTDRTTDATFLETTLGECWRRMDPASPNRQPGGMLTLLQNEGGDVAAVETLLAIADQVLAPRSPMPAAEARVAAVQ